MRSMRRLTALGSRLAASRVTAATEIAPLLQPEAVCGALLRQLSTVSRQQCAAPLARLGGASWALPLPAASSRGLQTSRWLAADMQVVVPPMGESISEGTVATVLKQPGDSVAENDIVAQIETDKVTVDVKYTNPAGGRVSSVLVKERDTVKVGQAILNVDVGAAGAAPAATPKAAPPKPAAAPAAPAAAPKVAPASPAAPVADAPPVPSGPRAERRVPMTRLRMRVAERLKAAQNTYALLTTFNEVDMSALMALRETYKDAFAEKHGVKLGFMSAFVKASADALRAVPAVNGVIDGTDVVYRDYCDISVAVATPKGLVVPVLRGADALSFAEVEKGINALGKKAREGTLSIDDMAGGTFTISNGGVYGSMLSTPIVNPPQSAILGMHNIVKRAVVVGDKIEARPVMYIALTYDHRLIDGREAVTFLKRVKEVIEDPRRLLLDV